jgi:hypothetical protein
MATSSYSNLFGTTGSGQQGSQAGIGTLFGQQPRQRRSAYGQFGQQGQQPQQTFAQMQQQGMARPAPQAPQGQPFQQFGGSEQAQQARTGMLSQLQQQLAQPTRFDTQAFQQIRGAQAANLQAEYGAEQKRLDEELARRGLSASSIGGGRMGDLAGQQARALSSLDAQLLQQAAQTQAQDRLAAMQAAGQFAELAGSQDLAQFEANRVAQAAEFAQGLQGAQFQQGQMEFGQQQALAAAQAQQSGQQSQMELALRRQLGLGELGLGERRQTAQEQQFAEQLGFSREQFQQQTADTAAERTLRETMQTRELTAAETQQLNEIEARKTLQAEQLGLQERLAQAEMTGVVSMLDANGKPVQVSTIAAQRLGQEGVALLMQQAAQMSQQTGTVYEIGADGKLAQKTVTDDKGNKVPVRTDSVLARLSQEELQKAELTGQIMQNGAMVDTLAAQRFNQDQLNQLTDQALRQSQLTGVMYKVGADGKVTQELVKDAQGRDVPISTEQRRAQQMQEQTQARQLASQQAEALSRQSGLSYIVGDDGKVTADMDTTKSPPIQRTTIEAQQLVQQKAMQETQLNQQRELALIEAGGSIPMMGADGKQMTDAQGNPMFRETVQARQVRQQYENQLAELRGYFEQPGVDKDGKPITVKIDTMAARQLSQQDRQSLAAQALERSQLTGFMYKVGADGQIVQEFTPAPDNKPLTTAQAQQASLDRELRRQLGIAEYGGVIGGQQTLQAQQQQQQLLIQLASVLAGSSSGIPADLLEKLKGLFGLSSTTTNNQQTTDTKDWLGGGGGGGGGSDEVTGPINQS